MAKQRKKRFSLTGQRSEALAAYVFLLPDVVGLIAVYIIPILFTIYISFFSWSGVGPQSFTGLANYREMFADATWLRSLGTTFLYILLYVPIIIVFSLALALLVNAGLREQKLYRSILFSPIMIPMVVAAVIWQLIYEPSSGFLNYLLGLFGVGPQPFLGSQNQALLSVLAVTVWKQVGYYMIIFLAGLTDVPVEYKEAALIDGANAVQRFFHVVLPTLKPIFVFVAVVNTISALQDFDQIYVLTRGGPNYATYVSVFYIYEKAFKYLKMGSASAASTVLFFIIFALSFIQMKLFKGGSND